MSVSNYSEDFYKNGTYIWKRNVSESIAWILCARKLELYPDLVKYIAHYLHDITYQSYRPENIAWCSAMRLSWNYFTRNETIIKFNNIESFTTYMYIASVICDHFKHVKNIIIISTSHENSNRILNCISAFLQNRVTFTRKHNQLHIAQHKSTIACYLSSRDILNNAELYITMGVDGTYLYQTIFPLLQLQNIKLIWAEDAGRSMVSHQIHEQYFPQIDATGFD